MNSPAAILSETFSRIGLPPATTVTSRAVMVPVDSGSMREIASPRNSNM